MVKCRAAVIRESDALKNSRRPATTSGASTSWATCNARPEEMTIAWSPTCLAMESSALWFTTRAAVRYG